VKAAHTNQLPAIDRIITSPISTALPRMIRAGEYTKRKGTI